MEQLLNDKDRAIWMRRLHAKAKELFEIDNPHPLLHQLAISEFGVESMSHISAKEVEILLQKLEENNVSWAKVEALGLTRIPEMSDKQKWIVKRIAKELGLNNDDLNQISMSRFGYLEYRYLTGKSAIEFVGYLIVKSRNKRAVKG